MLGIVSQKRTSTREEKTQRGQHKESLKPKNKPSLLKMILIDKKGRLIASNGDGIYHQDEGIEIRIELEIYEIDNKYHLFMRHYFPNGDIITGIPKLGHSVSGKDIVDGMRYFGGNIQFTSKKKKEEINSSIETALKEMATTEGINEILFDRMSAKYS